MTIVLNDDCKRLFWKPIKSCIKHRVVLPERVSKFLTTKTWYKEKRPNVDCKHSFENPSNFAQNTSRKSSEIRFKE